MNFVNLTPHNIIVEDKNGKEVEIKATGVVARVSTTQNLINTIEGIEIFKTQFGEVENLPKPKADTIYVVSAMVLSAVKNTRNDVFAPNTSKANRNELGHITSVRGLTR